MNTKVCLRCGKVLSKRDYKTFGHVTVKDRNGVIIGKICHACCVKNTQKVV